MDALVPAFVAALLAGIGDRPAWLAAILADRYGRPLSVVFAFAIAHAAVSAIAAAGAVAVAPVMTPNAKALLLALALIFAAAGAVWKIKAPDRLERWRMGAFATTLLGGFILVFGDRTAFLTFGIAARSPTPFMAAAGAATGSIVVAFVAVACGEATWLRLPLRRISAAAGGILFIVGALMALSALRIL